MPLSQKNRGDEEEVSNIAQTSNQSLCADKVHWNKGKSSLGKANSVNAAEALSATIGYAEYEFSTNIEHDQELG